MAAAEIKSFYDIPGYFWWLDRWAFATVLKSQEEFAPGHLVELGTYLGKSAVIIGDFVRQDERFIALDLFGTDAGLGDSRQADDNRAENQRSYRTLTREKFESNYLALHANLPEIVQAPSATITDHVEPGSVRFLHIDASHLYPYVHTDVTNAKTLLRHDGIVVFDDHRSEHTPGVTAAVWQAVFCDGLIPVAVTPMKMYAVFNPDLVEHYRTALRTWVDQDRRFTLREEEVLGRPLLRLNMANRDNTPKPVLLDDAAIGKIADAVADRVARSVRRASRPRAVPAPTVSEHPAALVRAGSVAHKYASGLTRRVSDWNRRRNVWG